MPQTSNKLIYILNQYARDEASHYHHIVNLIDEMGNQGVTVAVIIEKCADSPHFSSNNVTLFPQRYTKGVRRIFELAGILRSLYKSGYQTVFVRISVVAATIAILHRLLYGGTVCFWQSGTTHALDQAKPLNLKKIRWWLRSKLPFAFTVKYSDWFITGPESMARYYADVVGVKPGKIKILYNDVDVKRFTPIPPEQKYHAKVEIEVPADCTLLLFVHRLSPVKRTLFYLPYVLDRFYANCSQPDQFITVVVGDGSERPALQEALTKSGLSKRVWVVGRKPNKEIEKYYRAADLFINPTYEEGFPRVMIEAMASGLPIISTDAGGIRDIVGKIQTRYIIDRENRDAFSDKLLELMNAPAVRLALAIENYETAKRFSTERVADMYIKTIFGSS